jgi:hypothetical protein
MPLFTPLPSPPGLPPLLQSRVTPSQPPLGTVGTSPDVLSQEQTTAIYTSSGIKIPFPTTMVQEKNTHSLVQHLYPNQDNGRVENTGINPREWTISIPLTNHIYPANGESWSQGLWNNTFLKLKACLDEKASHRLDLPLETVIVKTEEWGWTSTGEKPRDGRLITVRFLECLDDNIILAQNIASINPISQMSSVANTLEGQYVRLTFFNPPGLSLQGLFTQVASFIKQAAAYPNNVMASINAQVTQLTSTAAGAVGTVLTAPATTYNVAASSYNQNKATVFGATTVQGALNYDELTLATLHTSYQSLVNTQSINTSSFAIKAIRFHQALLAYYSNLYVIDTAPMQQALLNMIGALQATYQQLLTQNKPQYQTLSMVTTSPITFMQVARLVNNSMDDIMNLNPNLTNLAVIPINSKVLYYSQTGQ